MQLKQTPPQLQANNFGFLPCLRRKLKILFALLIIFISSFMDAKLGQETYVFRLGNPYLFFAFLESSCVIVAGDELYMKFHFARNAGSSPTSQMTQSLPIATFTFA